MKNNVAYFRMQSDMGWAVVAWRTSIASVAGPHSKNGGGIIGKIEENRWSGEQRQLMAESGEITVNNWNGISLEVGQHRACQMKNEEQLVEYLHQRFLNARSVNKSSRATFQNNARPCEGLIISGVEMSPQSVSFQGRVTGKESLPLDMGSIVQIGEWVGGVGNFRRGVEAEGIVTSITEDGGAFGVSLQTMGVILDGVNDRVSRTASRRIVPAVNERLKLQAGEIDSRKVINPTGDRNISLEDDE